MAKRKNRSKNRQSAEETRFNPVDQENDVETMIKLLELKSKVKSYRIVENTIKAFKSFRVEFVLLCILASFDKMIIPTFI